MIIGFVQSERTEYLSNFVGRICLDQSVIFVIGCVIYLKKKNSKIKKNQKKIFFLGGGPKFFFMGGTKKNK